MVEQHSGIQPRKLLIINSVYGTGSTGRICKKIAEEYSSAGWIVKAAYGREPIINSSDVETIRIGNKFTLLLHGLITRLFDLHGTGLCSYLSTKKIIKWMDNWRPDLVWLHNLHGYYINYPLLFKWLKKHPEIEVKWNIHDCWPFTGHCSHFQVAGCKRWREGCCNCPEKREYPKTYGLSAASHNWKTKRKAFLGIRKMEIITPSRWLASLTLQGFMGQYPIRVEKHPFDKEIFKPTPSDFRERLGLRDKIIVLGVASVWDRRKGFHDFLMLRDLLDDDYIIVLVGLNTSQIAKLPSGVIGISRMDSPRELAKLYSAADWFFNPTHEDIYSMTNLEAASCGCRVVTYDTGGAPEAVEGYEKAWVLKGVDKSPEGFVRLLKTVKNL